MGKGSSFLNDLFGKKEHKRISYLETVISILFVHKLHDMRHSC